MGEKHSTLLKPKQTSIKLDYIISKDVLGCGVSGKVFKIKGIVDKKLYALKILKDNSKCRREVDLHWRASNCENIVKIIDVYENRYRGENSLLVVLEFMDGGELFYRIQERCKDSQFTEREAVSIVIQICSAISHLHSMNIAHRDLKPENILFSSRDSRSILKLTDFGFAKEVGENLNSLKTPCYTPYYVAPEVLGPQRYNKSCDMWSLGVITYILLCGYPPFYANNGQAISPGMKCRIRRGQYNFPEEEWKMVSSEAKDLIKNLLKTDPSKRLTIEEMLSHNWISKNYCVPETPLATGKVLMEEKAVWPEVQDEFSEALKLMRVDGDSTIKLKNVSESNNGLLRKRMKNKVPNINSIHKVPETICEEKSESSTDRPISNLSIAFEQTEQQIENAPACSNTTVAKSKITENIQTNGADRNNNSETITSCNFPDSIE